MPEKNKIITFDELMEILMESAVLHFHGNVRIGERTFLANITWNEKSTEYVIRLFEV